MAEAGGEADLGTVCLPRMGNRSEEPCQMRLANSQLLAGAQDGTTTPIMNGVAMAVLPRPRRDSIAQCFTSDAREHRFSGSVTLSWELLRSYW